MIAAPSLSVLILHKMKNSEAILFLFFLIFNNVNKCIGKAGIYLAINSLAFVDEFDNVVKRRLEIDWYGEEASNENI